MGQGLSDRFTGPGAGSARGTLLGAATVLVAVVVVVLLLAGVANGEVAATALFLPVFAAGVLHGRPAGYGAAALATVAYVALRSADLSAAGAASAGVLVLTRAGAYLVAGHVGALARVLVPGGDGSTGRSGTPRSRPAGGGQRRAAADRPIEGSVEAAPASGGSWDDPWPTERTRVVARDRARPVLATVGGGERSPYGDSGDVHGDDLYDDELYDDDTLPPTTMSAAWPPPPGDRGADEGDEGGWQQGGGAGWQDGDRRGGEGRGPAPAADRGGPPADDSWEAIQQSWREQHGLPAEEPDPDGGNGAWPHDEHGWATRPHQQAPSPAPGHGWDAPVGSGWDQQPGGQQAGGGWPGGAGAGDPEAWSEQQPGGWPQAPPPGAAAPWDQQPGGGWPGGPGHDGGATWDQQQGPGGWDAGAPPASGAWSDQPSGGGWGAPVAPAPADDPWGDRAPTGGTWPQPAAGDEWGDQQLDGGDGWAGAPSDPWSAPGPPTGPTGVVWDDPATGQVAEPAWSAPGDGGNGALPPGGSPGMQGPGAPLPAVDHETGLWTAQFLRDRLMAERHRSDRTGRPFSMVLVQVPDGPLAQLPYRRQVALLRELGYQFVAGGVVDHLVHVPDQDQHWFAVILPDTDRSGAQVLERRLRLGIGGYLSSRGLPLRDLESASLTAPDDDPAMGAIWDALIGTDDGPHADQYGY